jgi:hypothetical protein
MTTMPTGRSAYITFGDVAHAHGVQENQIPAALAELEVLRALHDNGERTTRNATNRFDAGGRAALGHRGRAPHRFPHRISSDVAESIYAARRQHPSWVPRYSCSGWHRGTHASSCRRSPIAIQSGECTPSLPVRRSQCVMCLERWPVTEFPPF